MGSFITPDPAMDGLNHYAYCSANPINYTDPTGLMKTKEERQQAREERKQARESRRQEYKSRQNDKVAEYHKWLWSQPYKQREYQRNVANGLWNEVARQQKSMLSAMSAPSNFSNPLYACNGNAISDVPFDNSTIDNGRKVYTNGISASFTWPGQSGNVSIGEYYQSKEGVNDFLYDFALHALGSPNADPISVAIAANYVYKNSNDFGIYVSLSTGTGMNNVNITELLNSANPSKFVSFSLTFESGTFNNLTEFKGKFYEYGGTAGHRGLTFGGNIARNLLNKKIGQTIEWGVSYGTNIEAHLRWGTTFVISLKSNTR